MPPSYSLSKNDKSNPLDLFNLEDPPNVSSVTLVQGFTELFNEKSPMQFKIYDFSSSRLSGSKFTGKGLDVDKGVYSISGSWHDSTSCTMMFHFKDFSDNYKCVLDWKASVISGSHQMSSLTISGGDPFRFTFFSI